MPSTTPFSELRKEHDKRLAKLPDRGEAIRAKTKADLLAELAAHDRTLGELRKARALTQTQLAQALDVTQAQVSRIETQADLYLSTLASYITAMGGELELVATFPDESPTRLLIGELADQPEAEAGEVATAIADRVAGTARAAGKAAAAKASKKRPAAKSTRRASPSRP